MSTTINGTTGITFPDASVQATAATGFGFKNRIINGAMMIDQRNAGASVTPTNPSYTLDRWRFAVSQASKLTVQQSSVAPTGFVNSLLVTSSSAYSLLTSDYFQFQQRIEGFNTADLAWGSVGASPVTLSFWVRSSITGTFGGAINNTNYSRSYPFSYVINAANTWEQKTVTIPGDTTGTWLTTNGIGIAVTFSLGMGSTYSGTAGSWAGADYESATGATSVVGTNGATFYITGVQLEKGSTATSFDYRPYGTELALCQRYCQSFTASGSAGLAAGTTGLYSDANTIGQTVLNWASSSTLRDGASASLTMVGTQGTDWAVSTSAGVNQTGFTITLNSNGNTIACAKTAHGLTGSSTFTRIITSSGKALITSEL